MRLTAPRPGPPGMMCTCCGAPVAVGMAKSRASVGATLASWIGNPILNPATIVFTAACVAVLGLLAGGAAAVLHL